MRLRRQERPMKHSGVIISQVSCLQAARICCSVRRRRRAGRPSVAPEIRRLIQEMSLANPLWGAPRVHGELLKLGIDVGQTSVAKYMAWRRRPPSQGWRTFLLNHADGIVSIDLFVVPTISFKLLYGLLILRHDRRQILWIGVTTSPTAEWIARQISEACGWEPVPDYLVRDRDRVYGEAFTRIRAMGIIAPCCFVQQGLGAVLRILFCVQAFANSRCTEQGIRSKAVG